MEVARIAAGLIDSIAWPLSAFGIALLISLLFKTELVALIGRVTSLEGPNFKVGFQTDRPASPDNTDSKSTTIDDRFMDTIPSNPVAAIIEAWIEVERDLTEAMHLLKYSLPRNSDPGAVIRALRSEGLVGDSDHRELMELLRIRNQVVHHQPVSVDVETAEEYIVRAALVRGGLRERSAQRDEMLSHLDPNK